MFQMGSLMGRPPRPRALSAVGVGLALRQARRRLPPRRVPLLGLAAAFLFAAQMVNFPVAGGTSGHLVGGVLVAALLGPSAAIVVLTTVLIVQCFLFADGGVLALGANVFNMAIVGAAGGYRDLPAGVPLAAGHARAGGGGRVCGLVFDGAGVHLLRGPARVVGHGRLAGGVYGDGERAHGDWHRRGPDQRAGVPGHPAHAARPGQRNEQTGQPRRLGRAGGLRLAGRAGRGDLRRPVRLSVAGWAGVGGGQAWL